MKFRSVRGTHDLLGPEINKFDKITSEISKLGQIFNFQKIETPVFESTELFSKPLGEQSDVVLKEMYTFFDRNKDSLTLRPEYTTPMIRAAISNNLLNQLPCKLFGIGPMFRRERPQKGRYRQFNQINFENFGSNDIFAEVELIHIADSFLKKILPNNEIELYINSLGDRNTLKKYKEKLTNFFEKYKINLSPESKEKIITNPIRILDSKDKNDKEIVSNAPLIIDFLSKDSLSKFDQIKRILEKFKINFKEDFFLVRGLDYYCDTVFEFKSSSLGSQDTIIGGGRYDGLIKILGGKNIPGVGWAGGIERIMMLMTNPENKKEKVHFAIINEKYKSHALEAYKLLSDREIAVYWNYKFNLKKSLSQSNESKAPYIIIIGEEEYNAKKYTIKNLKSGTQQTVFLDELIQHVKNG